MCRTNSEADVQCGVSEMGQANSFKGAAVCQSLEYVYSEHALLCTASDDVLTDHAHVPARWVMYTDRRCTCP